MKKSLKTLYDICDDSTATPETKLGAIKQLKPIQELQKQLTTKSELISQRDDEAPELNRQPELGNKALEAVEKQLKVAVEDKDCNNKKIDVLETDNRRLADERAQFDKALVTIETERDAAIARAKKAEAEAERLIASLTILADEFVPPQDRRSVGLRQLKAHRTELSTHWYLLMDAFDAHRHESELIKLRELLTEVRKEERPKGFVLYVIPDDAEFFGEMFLYRLLVERDKWLEKSLVDFFKSERADYSKWLNWDNGEPAATNDERERRRFCQARENYHADKHNSSLPSRVR